jgi:hypothetical protein
MRTREKGKTYLFCRKKLKQKSFLIFDIPVTHFAEEPAPPPKSPFDTRQLFRHSETFCRQIIY